jgi:hypothetical protein
MNDFGRTDIAARGDVNALDLESFSRNEITAANVHVRREPELLGQTLPKNQIYAGNCVGPAPARNGNVVVVSINHRLGG